MTLVDDIVASANALRDVLAANEHTITAQDTELRDLRAYADAQDAALADARVEIERLKAEIEQPPTPAEQWRVVNTGTAGLNVRSAPVVTNNALGKLPDGTVVAGAPVEDKPDWLAHTYKGQPGYSAIVYQGKTYLERVEEEPPDEPYHPSTTDYEGIPIIGERWDGAVLVGAGTADPGSWQLSPDALAAIETARLDSLKVMIPGFGWPEMAALHNINPRMFIVGRLFGKDEQLASAETFANYIRPYLYPAYDAGVRFFEVHNESNLGSEGMGRYWHNGAEFAEWWMQVVARLQPQFPDAKFGFPGLSPSTPDYWQFMSDADVAVRSAAWLGVHAYWSEPGGWPAAANAVTNFAREYAGKIVLCTEFSRQAGTDMAAKGAEYVDFYNHTHRGNVVALFAFVLSASGGFETERWTGTPIPAIVGSRDKEQ